MKIFESLKIGAIRSVKAWKGVLIMYSLTLFLIALIALPVKTGIKSVLGSSMVTELLSKGISLDVISDFGTNLNTIISSLSFGLFLILLLGGLMNVFLAGGLFSILKQSEKKPSAALFFEGGASNFLSFLIITVVSSLMILFIGFIIIDIVDGVTGVTGVAYVIGISDIVDVDDIAATHAECEDAIDKHLQSDFLNIQISQYNLPQTESPLHEEQFHAVK